MNTSPVKKRKEMTGALSDDELRIFHAFVDEIRGHPIYPDAELKRLHWHYKRGDTEAGKKIVRSFSSYVLYFLGRRFGTNTRHLLDLMQETHLAVYDALDSYNRRKGSLVTWIWVHMRARTQNHLALLDHPLRLPRNTTLKSGDGRYDWKCTTVRQRTARKVRGRTRFRTYEFEIPVQPRSQQKYTRRLMTLMEGDRFDEHELPSRNGDPVEHASENEQISRLWKALARLDPDRRELLTRRFGLDGEEPETGRDLARKAGLTTQAASWQYINALNELRAHMKDPRL